MLEQSGAPKGFLVALQIQLSGLAQPERHIVAPAASAAEAIERASQLVRDQGALAAVWVDRGPAEGGGPVVAYVVGDRQGRALIEVVRVPGDRGPELERTTALKIRELVAAMLRGQAARAEAGQLLQTEGRPPTAAGPSGAEEQLPVAAQPSAAQSSAALPNEQPDEPPPTAPGWTAFASAGIRLGSQPDLGLGRWGFGLGAGPVLDLRQFRLAVALGFDAFPSIEVERAGNSARFWEWTVGAALHAQMQSGPLWLGARAGPQLVGLEAHGTTRADTPGNAAPTSWALSLGLDAEVPLTRFVSLLAGMQLQALARHLHLDVNDDELVDLGRVRARVGLELTARF
ncbi:MAG TPA: hypothetical protein VFG30_18350 [Polyangiales bacterium]|nr:hypothetical protein [Polyangiales bacterium]